MKTLTSIFFTTAVILFLELSAIAFFSSTPTSVTVRDKQTAEITDWINTCPAGVVLTEHFAVRAVNGHKDETAAYIVCDFSHMKKRTML